jgi:hypothetical protein
MARKSRAEFANVLIAVFANLALAGACGNWTGAYRRDSRPPAALIPEQGAVADLAPDSPAASWLA